MKPKTVKPHESERHDLSELTSQQWSLVEKHLAHVRRFARFHRAEDAASVALLALMSAVVTFKPDLMKDPEMHLLGWIRIKVRYALLNAIAEVTCAPVIQAAWDFQGKYGRVPSIKELRKFSGCMRVEVRKAWAQVMAQLDLELTPDEAGAHECVPDGTVPAAYDSSSLPKEFLDAVREVLAQMERREAFLLGLKYLMGYEDREIWDIIRCAEILADLGWGSEDSLRPPAGPGTAAKPRNPMGFWAAESEIDSQHAHDHRPCQEEIPAQVLQTNRPSVP